jgi:hypothetical protein
VDAWASPPAAVFDHHDQTRTIIVLGLVDGTVAEVVVQDLVPFVEGRFPSRT